MKLLWVGVVLQLVFGKLVNGFLNFNGTELSDIESYEFGVSKATYNPVMVGLTLIQGAGAKGAGTFHLLLPLLFVSLHSTFCRFLDLDVSNSSPHFFFFVVL